MKIKYKLVPFILLTVVIIVTYYAYSQGLAGGFLLDDEVNLTNINIFNKFDGIDAFIRYIMSNQTGYLKRPITSLSFLLNANSWPTEAYNFKLTNLFLHLFNGILLFFVTGILLEQFNYKKNKTYYIALVSTAMWLLHPFWASTVLYVSQRMAILPTMFVLVGMFFYLKGRNVFTTSIVKSRIYMFIGVYVGTFLAVLSKENGVILPVLLLVLEYFLPPINKNLFKLEKRFFLVFPSWVMFIAFAYKFPDFIDAFKVREFSAWERLLSESRVLMTYLYHLLIPNYFTEGVYADGFRLSKSLLNPITTLYSSIAILVVIILAFMKRKKYPILCFAILFYFTGHLIESTVLNLELYFEHRNYLPSLFLFLPISIFFFKLIDKTKIYLFIPIIVIIMLAFFTNLNAKLWGNNYILINQSAQKYPESFRAIEGKVANLVRIGSVYEAIEVLNQSLLVHSSVSLKLKLMLLECNLNEPNRFNIDDVIKYISSNKVKRLDRSTLIGTFKQLVENGCGDNSLKWAEQILDAVKSNKGYNNKPIKQVINYFESIIFFKKGEIKKSLEALQLYIVEFDGYDDVMIAINSFINKSYYSEAEILINQMKERLFNDGNNWYLSKDYLKELLIVENKIKEMKSKDK